MLKALLQHPRAHGLAIDDPQTTMLRRAIIAEKPQMPLRYLLSGGVSLRALMPGWSFPLWREAEARLAPWMDRLAMFARIVLDGSAPTLGKRLWLR
ncbi:MAG: hypothetical protein WCP31_02135 [Chloroflexales bacterium]